VEKRNGRKSQRYVFFFVDLSSWTRGFQLEYGVLNSHRKIHLHTLREWITSFLA